ncbi:MAG: septum site-determining protein MinC [Gammaproteobacteria bacterium]|nr:MAG: septum site-determining protein MinC [Gammaproteobacteria bacterium]
MQTPSPNTVEASFTMKGALIPMTVLELVRDDPLDFEQVLQAKVDQAPTFFQDTPIVLALEKLEHHEQPIDFSRLVTICKKMHIYPVAIRGGSKHHITAARMSGLAILPAAGKKTQPAPTPPDKEPRDQPEATQPTQLTQTPESPHVVESARQHPNSETSDQAKPAKIVYTPVRSGQQVYASGTDLIVLAPVSAGAEILADGNIHVYGPLRGRALAGIKGDTKARIFCQSLEAELVSVAGQYKISEDLQDKGWREPRQIFLDQERLTIKPLV